MTHEGFLQDILAHPDDDAPRLIYADWLDEQGESERAEFIRVQIALARMDEDDERRVELEDRERELLAAHEATWEAPFRGFAGRVTFRRGLPDLIETQTATFILAAWRRTTTGLSRRSRASPTTTGCG